LEELGAEVIRAKLVWIMNVRGLGQQDEIEPLADKISASRRDVQEWSKEKAAADKRWIMAAAVAAVLAALIAVGALIYPVKS
jgi:hypothetical protein